MRKAETVLAGRCDSILLVLERPLITDNYLGCLRTAECMGLQNVWIVVQQRGYIKTEAPEAGSKAELKEFRKRVRLSRQSAQWLDVREFATTAECVAALAAGGWEVWATDLSEAAVDLMTSGSVSLPPKLAIVMGREADGCTNEMLAAAHKRVYLPLAGFNQSLNLQVATGMVLQQLLRLRPSSRGDMGVERKAAIRRDWYTKLARSEAQLSAFLKHVDAPPPPQATKAGLDVIVVDRKEFFDIVFANVRFSVRPAGAPGVAVPYADIPGMGTVKMGVVTELTKSSATLEGGEVIPFDYCAICTGSTHRGGAWVQPQGTTISDREAEVKATSEQVISAKSIVLVGGGPVGVEMAAEIVESYAGKTVTLVTSGAVLLEGEPVKVSKGAAQWMKDNKVEVVYGCRASESDGTLTMTPKAGGEAKSIKADLVIWATGSSPNTAFLKGTEFASAIDEAGRLKVGADLRVTGYTNVFALGDVCDVKETKLAYYAGLHGVHTAANVAMLAKSGDGAKLKAWKPYGGTKVMFVSLGTSAGVASIGGCVLPSFLVASMKSNDLFVTKYRAELGVKPAPKAALPATRK
ncbi:hypothetical protein FOA52_005436 [Chlamydomonas sp. UWO 241]|nr:hypothetical protein FOA52_005436 [Chlamydomonas sp. UWO 241]